MASRKYPPQDEIGILEAGERMKDNIGDPEDINLTAADVARLTAALTKARDSYDLNLETQATARTNRIMKDKAISDLEAILSEFNRRIQPLTTVDDVTRNKLGIPVYDTTATSAAKPTALPVVKIDNSMPMAQFVHFSDDDGSGKADGATAAQIHLKIGGDATGNIDDYRWLANDTDSPYFKEFTNPADAGKQAHYMVCWINSKGERGSFQLASATITSLLQNSNG